MSNLESLALVLKRHGVHQFPPVQHGAYFLDNPKTEIWGVRKELAELTLARSIADEVLPGEIVRTAVQTHLRLPPFIGETAIRLSKMGGDYCLVVDRDDTITMVIKAVAAASEDKIHLSVVDESLAAYLLPQPGVLAEGELAEVVDFNSLRNTDS
jgi:hypothetical protein